MTKFDDAWLENSFTIKPMTVADFRASATMPLLPKDLVEPGYMEHAQKMLMDNLVRQQEKRLFEIVSGTASTSETPTAGLSMEKLKDMVGKFEKAGGRVEFKAPKFESHADHSRDAFRYMVTQDMKVIQPREMNAVSVDCGDHWDTPKPPPKMKPVRIETPVSRNKTRAGFGLF